MTLQRRIYESRIQNLPENNKAGIGNADSNNAYVTGGVAGGEGDPAPVLPGPKPGGKDGKGPIPTQRWDGEKFTQEIQVPWSMKVAVDDIGLSVGALVNIKDNLGGFNKNKDVVSVIAKKAGADFYNLVSRVGLENAASMASGKNPKNNWEGVNDLLPPLGFWGSRPGGGERRASGDGGGGIPDTPGGGTEQDRDVADENYQWNKINNWLINTYGPLVWAKLGNIQTALGLSKIAGAGGWWTQIGDLLSTFPTDWEAIMLMILAWYNDLIGGNIGPGGLEPPNEEQSKRLADKAANSGIGSDVHFK